MEFSLVWKKKKEYLDKLRIVFGKKPKILIFASPKYSFKDDYSGKIKEIKI